MYTILIFIDINAGHGCVSIRRAPKSNIARFGGSITFKTVRNACKFNTRLKIVTPNQSGIETSEMVLICLLLR